MILIALMMAAAEPSAEARALGRELAEKGTLAAMLPVLEKSETAQLVADHPELSAADKSALAATAHQIFVTNRDRLLAADARSYATRLSIEDLRALAAFSRTPASVHLHSAMPDIIVSTMTTIGAVDFKGDVVAAFCKQSGKLCP